MALCIEPIFLSKNFAIPEITPYPAVSIKDISRTGPGVKGRLHRDSSRIQNVVPSRRPSRSFGERGLTGKEMK